MKLSIVIPVFNEENTIKTIIENVVKINTGHIQKEIIIIDDGSTDKTLDNLKQSAYFNKINLYRHEQNKGKGASIKTGLKYATGNFVVIQDADLEYDPAYIPLLLNVILEKKAQVVYGTRLKRWPNIFKEERSFRFFLHYFGNRFLSLLTSILFGQWITDIETGYKLFLKEVIDSIQLESNGFDIEVEITAKLLKNNYYIYEVPIKTIPRGYSKGKKLNTFYDGSIAFVKLVKYRFFA